MHLTRGTTYEADIQLSGLEAAFGSAGAVSTRLSSLGFTGVHVADLGHGKYHAMGIWNQPDKDFNVPGQISNISAVTDPHIAQQAAAAAAADEASKQTRSRSSSGWGPLLLVVAAVALLGRR